MDDILEDYRGCNGSHWGLTDWYDEVKKRVVKALKKGADYDWTTGWWSSKKAIASGKLTCSAGEIFVEVSVSDDFDAEGRGTVRLEFTDDVAKIHMAIDEAWGLAVEGQKDNSCVQMFAVSTKRMCYGTYVGGKPQGRGSKHMAWVETYLHPVGYGIDMDEPPGDCYQRWGWQGGDDVPADVKTRFEEWIKGGDYTETLKYKGWEIRVCLD